MLDIAFVRENPKIAKASELKRGRDPKRVDDILALDEQWRAKLKDVEQLKHLRNVVSQEINAAKKLRQEQEAHKKIAQMQKVVQDIKKGEEEVERLLGARNEALNHVGNILHEKVPKGKDDTENVELKTWGKKTAFSFPLKNHVELAESLGIADFDSSAKTSGNGFYFLKGQLGLLNQALIRFALDVMLKKKYVYIEPPLMIRKNVLEAAVDTTEFEKTIYSLSGEDLVLIGTSEHALLGIHSNETIREQDLPKKYFAYSMCFRKEVGAHGINEKGLWRTHQFK